MRWLCTVLVVTALAGTVQAQTCTRWASPTGGGNGLSQSTPYQITNFWSTAAAGSVLCLLDGTYTGTNSMIDPPDGKSGASGNPIIVKALNDGKVLISGQNARGPVKMQAGNNYIRLEGINACCSSGTVVLADDSTGDEFLRMVAWDAKDANYNVFAATGTGGSHLFEDVAGFGVGRKIFEVSQGGNGTVVRRGFGRWDKNTWRGPKAVATIMYNSENTIWENMVGTWGAYGMTFPYTLNCEPSDTHPDCGDSFNTVEQADDIFGMATNSETDSTNTKLLGALAYVKTGLTTYHPPELVEGNSTQLLYQDVVAYIPSSFTGKKAFTLGNTGTVNSTAIDLTGISQAASTVGTDWSVTDRIQQSNLTGINIFTGSSGGQLCYRYINGTLDTNQKLWPWPMNQRILDAMTDAGATNPVNVTADIEGIFGTIPSTCRWDVATLEPPINFHKVSP